MKLEHDDSGQWFLSISNRRPCAVDVMKFAKALIAETAAATVVERVIRPIPYEAGQEIIRVKMIEGEGAEVIWRTPAGERMIQTLLRREKLTAVIRQFDPSLPVEEKARLKSAFTPEGKCRISHGPLLWKIQRGNEIEPGYHVSHLHLACERREGLMSADGRLPVARLTIGHTAPRTAHCCLGGDLRVGTVQSRADAMRMFWESMFVPEHYQQHGVFHWYEPRTLLACLSPEGVFVLPYAAEIGDGW